MTGTVGQDTGFWVFAYGSLMWNPGFEASDRQLARLEGYRRSFCLSSIVYRGTPEAPGLVLALDAAAGASCTGLAYRVSGAGAAEVLQYLRDRELVSYAYRECMLPLALQDGRAVEGYCYVTDRAHGQYQGGLSLEQQADIIARAHGPAGSNREYLGKTAESLAALGIEDGDVARLRDLVAARS